MFKCNGDSPSRCRRTKSNARLNASSYGCQTLVEVIPKRLKDSLGFQIESRAVDHIKLRQRIAWQRLFQWSVTYFKFIHLSYSWVITLSHENTLPGIVQRHHIRTEVFVSPPLSWIWLCLPWVGKYALGQPLRGSDLWVRQKQHFTWMQSSAVLQILCNKRRFKCIHRNLKTCLIHLTSRKHGRTSSTNFHW